MSVVNAIPHRCCLVSGGVIFPHSEQVVCEEQRQDVRFTHGWGRWELNRALLLIHQLPLLSSFNNADKPGADPPLCQTQTSPQKKKHCYKVPVKADSNDNSTSIARNERKARVRQKCPFWNGQPEHRQPKLIWTHQPCLHAHNIPLFSILTLQHKKRCFVTHVSAVRTDWGKGSAAEKA